MHKVLHFSNKPAFPLRDGGCIAISSILRSLLASDGIEVVHLTLSTFKHSFKLESYPLSWREKMTVENVAIETKTNIFDAFRYLLMNKSYNVVRFYDKNVEKKLIELIQKHQFDSVVMESIYLLPYLQIFKKYGIKIILRTHNVEHKIWSSLAENSTSLLKKWYLNKLSLQLEKYELENCKEVDGIISITEDDSLFFSQFEPKTHTTCIPPMVVINEENTNYDLSDFYFLGAMDWQPNIEGINWFIKDVIPDGLIGTEFYLGGKNLNKKDYQHEGITNVGEVENAVDFIKEHGICVIPLHSGSGLKIKLLENMALGKPIITTSEGARGVGVRNNEHVLITDDADEFRELMYKLNIDKDLRQRLGQNAKEFVATNYSEEKLTGRLIAFIKDI